MELERTIVERAQGGDDSAFEELVLLYTAPVFSFTYRLALDRDLAEDATQEAFLKAWKNLKQFDPEKPFKPWLFAIARNAALDVLRKRTPINFSKIENGGEDFSIETTIADPEPLPDELFARKELGEEVRRAVASLVPRDRALLALRYEEGLSFEAIAEVLKAPVNTIKSWHHRALARLRPALNPERGGAPKHHD